MQLLQPHSSGHSNMLLVNSMLHLTQKQGPWGMNAHIHNIWFVLLTLHLYTLSLDTTLQVLMVMRKGMHVSNDGLRGDMKLCIGHEFWRSESNFRFEYYRLFQLEFTVTECFVS